MGTTAACRTIMLVVAAVEVLRGIPIIIDPEVEVVVEVSVPTQESRQHDESDGVVPTVHPLATVVEVAAAEAVDDVIIITTTIISISIIQTVGSTAVILRCLRTVLTSMRLNPQDEPGNVQLRKVVDVLNNLKATG